MKTNYLIIGKGDDIITMILDNLYSNDYYGKVDVWNNLGLTPKYNFSHPRFEITLKEEVNTDDYTNWILGVYKPDLKLKIITQLNLDITRFSSVIHKTFDQSLTSTYGFGCLVNSNVTIAAHTKIGNFVSINRGVTIGHHVDIGDFVSINPGVNIGGHTTIGEGTQIGIGAQVLNQISIGKNSVIGAGSVVTRDIPDGVVAWGSPCKIIRPIDGPVSS